MKRVVLIFIGYFFYWFCYFVVFRIIFLVFNYHYTILLGWNNFLNVFLYGAKMDLSIAGYISLLPSLLLVFSSMIKPIRIATIISGYTLLILIVVTMLGLADIVLYQYWGMRLNGQVLPYLLNPAGIMLSVSGWQLLFFLISLMALVYFAFWVYRSLFKKDYFNLIKPVWYVSPVMLVMTLALIIPIRGNIFGTSPLNFSSVYFSKNLFANHSAYNFFWSFIHAVVHHDLETSTVHYFDEENCKDNLIGIDQPNQKTLPVYINTEKKVNVVLVLLESFSNKVIEPLGGLPGYTPRLNQFCKEGILFSSFYATGNRSDKGIASLFASYPSLIKASSIMGFPEKMEGLDYFLSYFKRQQYAVSFYYGGDVDFYNTRMLLIKSGVDKIISSDDFPKNVSGLQNWGVPDQFLYSRMLDDLMKTSQPFFDVLYTVSSHEPYDVPDYKKIRGESLASSYLNAVCYADSCLGNFIDSLKRTPLWKNTLVIITADHASLEPDRTTFDDPASYRIPMVWLGGVVDTAFVVDNIAMQTDLSPTIIQQLGWKPNPSYLSKNIFSSSQYAFFLRDEGWGFLSPEAGFFMNIESGNQKYFYGEASSSNDSLLQFSKAYIQFLHDDFMKR